ncbi:MAG: M23 family metallopeptidase, partial [Candidatus Margulisiibacteriota bacterium]
GQYVKKGEIVGYCGNSGRSAEPHLHFQIQATPLVGSRTLDFPLGYYWKRSRSQYELCQYDKPKKGDYVSNLIQTTLLQSAFIFLPGQKLIFDVTNQDNRVYRVEWEVTVDAWNQSYLYCSKTQSKAYFYNDGLIHYFRNFEGNRRSALFYFFLALYKVPLEFKPQVIIKDHFAPHHLTPSIIRFWIDFVAPFFTLFESEYELTYQNIDSLIATRQMSLVASSKLRIGSKVLQNLKMQTTITSKGIQRITVNSTFIKNMFNSLFFGAQLKQLDVCI